MVTIGLYTRPGCRFCMTLRRWLRKRGIELREINIRRDPEARARVRAAGNGNEIVPTVHVGAHWLVNPSVNDIPAQIDRVEKDNRSMVPAPAVPHDNNPRRHFRPIPPAGIVLSHSDENGEERAEMPHRVHALTYAARAIRMYRTTVVTCGTAGIVVDVHPGPRRTTYTVEFQPKGLAGATIRVPALTDADLKGTRSAGRSGRRTAQGMTPPNIHATQPNPASKCLTSGGDPYLTPLRNTKCGTDHVTCRCTESLSHKPKSRGTRC